MLCQVQGGRERGDSPTPPPEARFQSSPSGADPDESGQERR